MANDYSTFQASVARDLNTASIAAQAFSSGKTKKLRITHSDLKALVPPGSEIELQPTVFTKLKAGDVIYVRAGKDLMLRRFIKLKITAEDSYLAVTHDGQRKAQVLPKSALVGKVVQVHHNGKAFDPSKESALKSFVNSLTEFGTHIPFSGLLGKK